MNFKYFSFAVVSFFFIFYSNPGYSSVQKNHAAPFIQDFYITKPYLTSELKTVCIVNPSFILLGGSNYILAYNGEHWINFSTEGAPVFIKKNTDEAIVAAGNSLISVRKQGKFVLRKAIFDFTKDFENFSTITNVVALPGGAIYFSTPQSVYKLAEKEVKQIDYWEPGIKLFASNKTVFYKREGEGFYKLNPDVPLRLPLLSVSAIAGIDLLGFYETDATTYAISTKWPWLWVVKEKKLIPSSYELGISERTTQVKQLKHVDSLIFLGTDSEGVFSFPIKESFPIEGSNFVDFSPVAPNRIVAISRTSVFEALSIFSAGFALDSEGRHLLSNSVALSKGLVYCATDEGVYVNCPEVPHSFTKISKEPERFIKIIPTQFGPIALGQNSVSVLRGRAIVQRVFSPIVCPDSHVPLIELANETIVALGHEGSVSLVRIDGNGIGLRTFELPNKLHSPQQLFFSNNLLYILLPGQKTLTVDPAAQNAELKEVNFSEVMSEADWQWKLFKETYNLNDPSVFVSPLNATDTTLIFKHYLSKSPQKSIWVSRKKANAKLFELPVCYGLFKSQKLINGACLSDNKIWVSSPDGLLYLSLREPVQSEKQPFTLIAYTQGESITRDTLLSKGLFPGQQFSVEPKSSRNKKLKLEITPGEMKNVFLGLLDSQYSFRFEGPGTEWSEWSGGNIITIDLNLPKRLKLWVRVRSTASLQPIEFCVPINIKPQFYQNWLFVIAFVIIGLLGILLAITWRRYYHAKERYMLESIINQRTEDLVREKEKTDNLLARVLPTDTASELKEKGKVNSQRFQMVTVLFSDIEGFTRITEHTNPENLIDQLDKFFLYFDSVVERYRIEKIKTIGDAYMCAGGIPKKNRTNPIEVVLAALEMMQYMKHITSSSSRNEKIWDLRIGIDTGPVIAGVVGRNKLTYDIWGSTVNTASRMESSGEVGQINISGNTYMFVKEYFDCTYRGVIPVKNKGDIHMYFVNGIKASLSNNFEGLQPNHAFNVQLQLIRLGDLEEFILEKLEQGLPKNLYYHNLKHTVDVYTQVELIGRSENLGAEDILLLRTAALFHDAGHMIDYSTHEEMSVKLVREILPEYYYSQEQIDIVSQLIMATKMPPRPKNLLEQIMCDADLDYLGRVDFLPVSNKLYQELHEHGKVGTLREWNELQIKFIESHQYFTSTARRLRNVNKNSQLAKLRAWLEKN